jgi:hypothetical protein
MQLKKSRGLALAQALTQASAALLGTVIPFAAQAEDNGWQVDTAALFYQESDSRVQAIEPEINLRKDFGDENIFNLKLVVDTLSGASPNGAAPAKVPQTFSGPSGSSSYTTAAGQTPLDTSFRDARGAVSVGWQQPLADNLKLNVGGNISTETDFQSIGFSGALARDINNKNTTLSAGLNLEVDNINPVGGTPLAFSSTALPQEGGGEDDGGGSGNGAKNRTAETAVFGLTQVLGRHSLMQLNYSVSVANGYQSDPYKLLTVLDSSNKLIPNPDPANPGNAYTYLYEKRPDKRTKQSIFAEWKYAFSEDVLDLSYRYTTDDWGIHTHTLEGKYRLELGHDMYIEPHVRHYTQTEASFYTPYLLQGRDVAINGSTITPLVSDASADPRLGAFDGNTFGLKFGIGLGPDSELNFRVEKYDQKMKQPDAPATGDLAGQKMAPDMSAMWVQVGYSFRW